MTLRRLQESTLTNSTAQSRKMSTIVQLCSFLCVQRKNANITTSYFPLYAHIHCLVPVCQPFIKLLLTYLLSYLSATLASVRPVHTPHDVVRQPLCDNGRRRPLLSVVARQITCIGMLMICKYSSEMAEYAVADAVMAAATFS